MRFLLALIFQVNHDFIEETTKIRIIAELGERMLKELWFTFSIFDINIAFQQQFDDSLIPLYRIGQNVTGLWLNLIDKQIFN